MGYLIRSLKFTNRPGDKLSDNLEVAIFTRPPEGRGVNTPFKTLSEKLLSGTTYARNTVDGRIGNIITSLPPSAAAEGSVNPCIK